MNFRVIWPYIFTPAVLAVIGLGLVAGVTWQAGVLAVVVLVAAAVAAAMLRGHLEADGSALETRVRAEADQQFRSETQTYITGLQALGNDVSPVWVRQIEMSRTQMESAITELT